MTQLVELQLVDLEVFGLSPTLCHFCFSTPNHFLHRSVRGIWPDKQAQKKIRSAWKTSSVVHILLRCYLTTRDAQVILLRIIMTTNHCVKDTCKTNIERESSVDRLMSRPRISCLNMLKGQRKEHFHLKILKSKGVFWRAQKPRHGATEAIVFVTSMFLQTYMSADKTGLV